MRKTSKSPSEKIVKRGTRRHHLSDEKIKIALDDMRGEDSIVELWRLDGFPQSGYYKW